MRGDDKVDKCLDLCAILGGQLRKLLAVVYELCRRAIPVRQKVGNADGERLCNSLNMPQLGFHFCIQDASDRALAEAAFCCNAHLRVESRVCVHQMPEVGGKDVAEGRGFHILHIAKYG